MITLIGTSLAKTGLVFTFYGGSNKCETCRFKKSCLNLEKGRKYIIKDVKKVTHACPLHKDGKVKTVEVELATIRTSIETKKAYKGSTIIFRQPECECTSELECEYWDICHPEGLLNDDKCQIKEIGPQISCKNGIKLTEVILSL
ncbi:MAG: UPF0179 family protein [Methanosphaera stadtmanae]|nr:UPF0179 family protein [Methanosphaera stadtmanae]